MMMGEQLVLEEDYDENYKPTDEEIFEYAQIIGIDPYKEGHLMWIAKEGIIAPLPEHWRPCQDTNGDLYYFNFALGTSIWDHPCDEFYRQMVIEERMKFNMNKGSGPPKSGGPSGGPPASPGKKGKAGKDDGKKKKEKPGKPKLQLGPLKAEQSMGTPSMHGGLEPMRSLGGSLAPLRGSTGTSQPMSPTVKSSFNTTTGSLKLSKSGNLTSSMSIPFYSNEFEDDGPEEERPHHSVNLTPQEMEYQESGESDQNQPKGESETDSEDFGKEIDFGIDKNLSERIMDMDIGGLEPVRGSLEKLHDFEGTMSAMSTARGDSPGGKMSPIDRFEEERKRRAEIAASAAEKRLTTRQESYDDKMTYDEEHNLRASSEMRYDDLRDTLDREFEDKRLEMLEDKDRRIKRMRDEIKREQEEEERKLKMENEEYIRKQMDRALENLRAEVNVLQRDEQTKLESQKREILSRINNQVESASENEQKRLEDEKNTKVESLQRKYDLEVEKVKDEMERKHRNKIEQLKMEMGDQHEENLKKITNQIKRLEEQEKEQKEQQLDMAKQRQRAIDDLDRGLSEVLDERRKEIKDRQEKEIQRLKEDHENEVKKMKDDNNRKEKKEQTLLEDKLKVETRRLQKQYEKDTEEVQREYERKKDAVKEQLEDEDEDYQEKLTEYERKKTDLNKLMKNLESQEQKLAERKKKFRDESDGFDKDQEAAFSGKASNLGEKELERMREERRQLREEIRSLQDAVDALKTEKRQLEGDITKLKFNKEQMTRKINEMQNKIDRKSKDFTSLNQKIIDAAEEEKSFMDERLRASKSDKRRRKQRFDDTDFSDEEDIGRRRRGQDRSEDFDDPSVGYNNYAWQDLLSDESQFDDVPAFKSSGVRQQFAKEINSISMAKEFLRKQRHSLKRRQSGLTAARQELMKDMIKQGQGGMSASVLQTVQQSLDKETAELDDLANHMKTGSKLVREKERKLRHLRNRFGTDSASDSEIEYSPFEYKYQSPMMPSADLSDEESSGISSNDNDLDNVIKALSRQNNQLTETMSTLPAASGTNPIAQSLQKVNSELARIISVVGYNNVPNTPAVTQGVENKGGSSYIPIYMPKPPSVAWSEPPPSTELNPYLRDPNHKIDYSSLVLSAEQSLERKWRKYFGDRRPPITSIPTTLPTHNTSMTTGHVTVREQLRQFRLSLHDHFPSNASSTQDRLTEQRQWLKKFGQDISFGGSIRGPGSETGSVQSFGEGYRNDGGRLTEALLSTSTPQRRPSVQENVRLELDQNNEIRLRHL
ncbi:centrosomal protein of 164 kDa-like isoform X3 [Mytilus edulis]|uniref:centrosomal protein of 164 kDa-like isoform X3 n=1 Tax=Mytilus edulis TaxID=6550 RepID=UPI0039EF9C85